MIFDYESKLPSDKADGTLADELTTSSIPGVNYNGVLNYGEPVGEATVHPTRIVSKADDWVKTFGSLLENFDLFPHLIDYEDLDEYIVSKVEEMLYPEKIIRNPKKHATTVKWSDGTYTTVKCSADDTDDPYFAFCSALAKKVYGSNSKVQRFVKTKTEELKPKKKAPTNKKG